LWNSKTEEDRNDDKRRLLVLSRKEGSDRERGGNKLLGSGGRDSCLGRGRGRREKKGSSLVHLGPGRETRTGDIDRNKDVRGRKRGKRGKKSVRTRWKLRTAS